MVADTFSVESLKPRKLFTGPSLIAVPISSTEIDPTYTMDANTGVQIEVQGPRDANFHLLATP